MKTPTRILLAALLLGPAPLARSADTLGETLQKGLFEEEANHNLDAAIKAYQSVLRQTDEQRKLAATAVFRLGECYRKLGRTNEAAAQYERVLQEFSSETVLATLSKQNLAGLGVAPAPSAPRALSKQARFEQKRLLEEEIALAEQEVKRAAELAKEGVADQASLRARQREVLELRRQLAGLDAGPAFEGAGSEAPGTDDEEKELQRIKAIIKDSPDLINARDQAIANGTPLHKAAKLGYATVAQFLLTHGAEVDPLNDRDETPLGLAAASGHKAVVELLLGDHAAVDGRQGSATPLQLAAGNGHKMVVSVLLAHNARVGGVNNVTPLHFAVIKGYRAVAELLLEYKADVNAATTAAWNEEAKQWPKGSTPLHIAAARGDVGMAEWLCAHGADVNARDASLATPLHYAAMKGSGGLMELVAARKADINLKNNSGATPLLLAARFGNAAVVAVLLAHGADVNAHDDERDSPLHEAVKLPSQEALKAILARRPNLELREKSGLTPLQLCVLNGSVAALELLLEAGADPNVVYAKGGGNTPLHLAAQSKSKQKVELLLAHKADVNAQNRVGSTPLDLIKFPAGAQAVTAEELVREEIANLLRTAGAKEDLRRFSSISIGRKARGFVEPLFYKGSNNVNHYTLLELISAFYMTEKAGSLSFPNFAGITIQRLKPEGVVEVIRANLDELFISEDCSKDISLEWGDIVDLPEADHRIAETWDGLQEPLRETLRQCLARKVTILVKEKATPVALRPRFWMGPGRWDDRIRVSEGIVLSSFKPREVVYGSNLLLSSSDLTRVKVKRKEASGAAAQEWVFDLTNETTSSPDLWLRDGDVIEVPEK